jgi:hypothetical protein
VRWRARDIVGVYLDADLLEMRFFVNGQDLGTAFAGYQVLSVPAYRVTVAAAATA